MSEVHATLAAALRWAETNSAESWKTSLAPEDFRIFPAAEAALRRFAGLEVKQRGPGVAMPREDFSIDPALAFGEMDRFRDHSDIIGLPLYPLGECGGGHYFLAIATDGRVFALMDGIVLIGGSIDEAVHNLIVGQRGSVIR
jgi:hypothetical protein